VKQKEVNIVIHSLDNYLWSSLWLPETVLERQTLWDQILALLLAIKLFALGKLFNFSVP
jgi:hypothetical protein